MSYSYLSVFWCQKNFPEIKCSEVATAEELKVRLEKLGYAVVAHKLSGMEAIKVAEDHHIDCVFMDINLGPEPNGIEVGEYLKKTFNIPVIYVTACSDDETLQRTKVTTPYGYIIKPFQNNDLKIAVEIALYKTEAEREIQKTKTWLAAILNNIADAVVVTDSSGRFVMVNPEAERIVGINNARSMGKHFPSTALP